MNSLDFLNEVVDSDECPENFNEIFKEFQLYQKLVWDMLKEFHRICENNNISYQLAYGSLLGIIRDGGQIPWDYDVDVLVPYEEKEQLISVLKKELNDKYYFYCPEINQRCRHVIMRLAPKGYRSEMLHVDVFYYIGVPDDTVERKIYVKKVKNIAKERFYKLVKIREEADGVHSFLFLLKSKLLTLFKPLSEIESEYEKLCAQYSLATAKECVSADSYADWYYFPSKYLRNTRLIETQDGEWRIPVEYDALLNIIYGDYNHIPSLEDRIKELLFHYRRLKFYEKLKR